jgi:Xaa-Pro aminopeptidase
MPALVEHPDWLHELYFPPEEYEQRLARARRLMDEYGFDGLLTTDDRTNFYYTGYGDLAAGGARARPRFVFLPRNGEPIHLCHASWTAAVKDMSWAEVREYVPLGCPVGDVAAIMREVGLECGRIGVGLAVTEMPHISASDHTLVEPGMVLAMEPGYSTATGLFHIEQNILVTERGYENLSTADWQLATIDG